MQCFCADTELSVTSLVSLPGISRCIACCFSSPCSWLLWYSLLLGQVGRVHLLLGYEQIMGQFILPEHGIESHSVVLSDSCAVAQFSLIQWLTGVLTLKAHPHSNFTLDGGQTEI